MKHTTNNSSSVDLQALLFADGANFTRYGRGVINEVKIPVQECVGQTGEEAYFRDNTDIHSIVVQLALVDILNLAAIRFLLAIFWPRATPLLYPTSSFITLSRTHTRTRAHTPTPTHKVSTVITPRAHIRTER